MADDDVDDIFKDFEHKVEGKGETSHVRKNEIHNSHEKKINEEENLKSKFEKEQQILKHKYKKEKEAIEDRKKKEVPKHGEAHHKKNLNIERVAFIAVILVLIVYIVIDLSSNHGNKSIEEEDQTTTDVAVEQEDESKQTEEVMEEVVEEEPEEVVEEEKVLSGKIKIVIDKVDAEVVDDDKDIGHISKITFTINNGKEKSFNPVVNVYAFDTVLDESWETRSRGKYTGAAIKSGEKQSGFIDLSPKTFKNLDIKKSIRLSLDDSDDGFITSANMDVTIS